MLCGVVVGFDGDSVVLGDHDFEVAAPLGQVVLVAPFEEVVEGFLVVVGDGAEAVASFDAVDRGVAGIAVENEDVEHGLVLCELVILSSSTVSPPPKSGGGLGFQRGNRLEAGRSSTARLDHRHQEVVAGEPGIHPTEDRVRDVMGLILVVHDEHVGDGVAIKDVDAHSFDLPGGAHDLVRLVDDHGEFVLDVDEGRVAGTGEGVAVLVVEGTHFVDDVWHGFGPVVG